MVMTDLLYFYAPDYLKEKTLCFINVININNLTLNLSTNLDCKSKQEKKKKNNSISVTNSKKKVIKKAIFKKKKS